MKLVYIVALVSGVLLGMTFPAMISWWLIFTLLVVGSVVELIGSFGFATQWSEYRLLVHSRFTGVVICGFIGVLMSGLVSQLVNL